MEVKDSLAIMLHFGMLLIALLTYMHNNNRKK